MARSAWCAGVAAVSLACVPVDEATDSTQGAWQGFDVVDSEAEDSDVPAPSGVTVRVATWNIESVGTEGSASFAAAARVLARLDADVLCVNEVEGGESRELAALATEGGYLVVGSPPSNPFGGLRNGMISRLAESSPLAWPTAGSLSPTDSGANDVTRLPVVGRFEVPGAPGHTLAVVCQHWKSGFDEVDVFRRAVDGVRTAAAAMQAGDSGSPTVHVVAAGDVNAEIDDPTLPTTLDTVPFGLPSSYRLGDDVRAALDNPKGWPTDPFGPLRNAGFAPVEARQRDDDDATRPASGRRLDYLFVEASPEIEPRRAEVYDTRDEYLNGLADGPEVPENADGALASDHLPVLVELRIAAGG